jgi:hypothetical protein
MALAGVDVYLVVGVFIIIMDDVFTVEYLASSSGSYA